MRNDVAARYQQMHDILFGNAMFIEEIMTKLRTSENYARKLVGDLMHSGHIGANPIPNKRGRTTQQFYWVPGKPVPTESTRKPKIEVKIERTDPLMIALYGQA
ncbi:hypothetical protein [Undibacterium sp. TJN19]|uniref:hypothetical protein n=1 Tax=Undibacterium sp. TJN19 TaxID=3413055 RepID=UPI003BF10DFE